MKITKHRYLTITIVVFFVMTVFGLVATPTLAYKFLSPLPTTGDSMNIGADSIGVYLSSLYRFALQIIGLVALLMMTIGGVQWLMANGNASKISGAKETILGAITGLLLALGSWTILNWVNPTLVNVEKMNLNKIAAVKMDPINFTNFVEESTVMESSKVANCKDASIDKDKLKLFWDSKLTNPPQGLSLSEVEQAKYCNHFYIGKLDGDKYVGAGQCDAIAECPSGLKCAQTFNDLGTQGTVLEETRYCERTDLQSVVNFCEVEATKRVNNGQVLVAESTPCDKAQGMIWRDYGSEYKDKFLCEPIATKGEKNQYVCQWCPEELWLALARSSQKHTDSKQGCAKTQVCKDLEYNDVNSINHECFDNYDSFITKIKSLGFEFIENVNEKETKGSKSWGEYIPWYAPVGTEPEFLSDYLFNACAPRLCKTGTGCNLVAGTQDCQ